MINNWRLKPKEIDYDAYHTELVGPGSTRSDLVELDPRSPEKMDFVVLGNVCGG